MTRRGLEGKRALVTGANGGIGRAVITALRAQGAEVATTDRVDADIVGDLTDPAFCDVLPGLAAEQMGGLDVLVNNAGIITRGKITDATDEDLSRSLAVNVEAPFRICRAAIPLLAGTGGEIVNIGSCWGVHPGPDHPIYCMTKSALASLTQCLGRDHAHQGIRVNAVCPNEVDTPMLRTGFEIRGLKADRALADLNTSVPLGRVAEPEDIADVVVFLASDQSRYMSGALVEVNGGKPVG